MAGYLKVNKTVTSFNEIYQLTSDEKRKTLGTAMVHYEVYDKARTMAKDNSYHTHTPDQIGLQYAGVAADGIGSSATMYYYRGDGVGVDYGEVTSGENLYFAGVALIAPDNTLGVVSSTVRPPGSWMCTGYTWQGAPYATISTFKRVY